MLNQIPGVSCVEPKGALYVFPKLDKARFNITDDERFVLDLLRKEKVLVVQGSAFNLDTPDHFRLVFLPRGDELTGAIARLTGTSSRPIGSSSHGLQQPRDRQLGVVRR